MPDRTLIKQKAAQELECEMKDAPASTRAQEKEFTFMIINNSLSESEDTTQLKETNFCFG